jgi:hypothetical protein
MKRATQGAKLKPKAKSVAQAKSAAKAKPAVKRSAPAVAAAADWRADALARMRTLILEADPEIVEERKWKKPSNAMKGVPVWSRHGIICTGETYKNSVKLTFAWGARLPDPAGLFNAGFGGNTRRAIDIHEGESVNASAFQALVRAAIARNADAKNR